MKRRSQTRTKFFVAFTSLERIKLKRVARFLFAGKIFENHRLMRMVVIPGRLREQAPQHRRDAGDGIKL